jgi:hypothetical protein
MKRGREEGKLKVRWWLGAASAKVSGCFDPHNFVWF